MPDDGDRDLRRIETREADVEAPPVWLVRLGRTFGSFRHRDYALFWSGALVSNVGTWMQMYALTIVVYAFRRSQVDLGLVSFASGIPVLLLAMYAGELADRLDRRRLIMVTQAVLLVQAALLGRLYTTGALSGNPLVSLTWVAGLGLVSGVMSALSFPSWQSIMPDLVPRETLLNAIALNAAQFQSARLLGPLAAAALVLAGAGMGEIFYVNAISFLFVIAALWVIHPKPREPHPHHETDEGAWRRLTAGVRYAAGDRVVGVLIVSVAMMTVFAMPYMMLLPAVVDRTLGFHGQQQIQRIVSYIMAANGLGAVVGALTVASLPKGVRRENMLRFSLGAMGLLLLLFAYSRWLPLTLVASAATGAAFLTSVSLANTTIQSTVPDRLRGRVMALFIMSFMGLMPLSSAAFGPLGQFIGPSNAIGLGAVVLIAWVATLFGRPELLGLGPSSATETG